MPYELPAYVRSATANAGPVAHEWDDWDPYSKLALPDADLKARLERVSNRGLTAFALGCAEWTVGRLSRFGADERTGQYLEAFWAYTLGRESAVPPETDQEEWQGRVRGPVNLSLMTVLNTVLLAEFGPPAQNAAFASRVALHVLPEMQPFQAWQDAVVGRLALYCVRAPDDPDGEPVPRELLDPARPFDPAERSALVDAALAAIDFDANPYLRGIE